MTSSTFSAMRSFFTKTQFNKLLRWIKQELVQQDSCDFWRNPASRLNDMLIDKLLTWFYFKAPEVLESNEPCRAALDKVVEMYKCEFSPC